MQPTPYLFFKGNCLEAVTHYVEILGGTIERLVRNADAPDLESRMPGGDDLVMHVTIRIGNTMIMASDAPEDRYSKPQGFSVSIAPSSLAEFERIFAALASDPKTVLMPPAETFWAERFTMFIDRFGTPWMLSYEGAKARS